MFALAYVAGVTSGVSGAASRLPSTLFGFTAVLSSAIGGLQGSPYQGFKSVEEALKHYGFETEHCKPAAQYATPPGSPDPSQISVAEATFEVAGMRMSCCAPRPRLTPAWFSPRFQCE